MKKSLSLLLVASFLLIGMPFSRAAQKVCSSSQLSKIYKLNIEFNNNRANLQQWILLVNRSVDGLQKSYQDLDVSAEQLWSQNYDTSADWVIKLNAREKQILNNFKKAFGCTGYGTVVDSKYGYIEVTQNAKVKIWPASITLKAKPLKITPKEPIALSNAEAKKCNSVIKDRVYIKYTNLKNDNSLAQVYGLENMSDCEVHTNIKFTVYCEARNPLLVNQKFGYPVTYSGFHKFEPRESKKISEDGFAPSVWQQCYQITKKNINFVSFQPFGPDVTVTFVTEPKTESKIERKTCIVGGACPVGSIGPGGGIVFYDAGSIQTWGRYLEVARNGWFAQTGDPKAAWCEAISGNGNVNFIKEISASEISSHLGKEIGKGKANTELMLTKCSSGAAKVAVDYQGGGMRDWFLPSEKEFWALAKYLDKDKSYIETTKCADCNHEYTLYEMGHWTSSEIDEYQALTVYLSLRLEAYAKIKGELKYIRPIRSF